MILTLDDVNAMTDKQLRLKVALRNGWEKRPISQEGNKWVIAKKDTFIYGGFGFEIPASVHFYENFPDWTGNLDTAFDLLNKAVADDETMIVDISISSVYQLWHVRIRSGIRAFSADDPSLAVAICRAWLWWKTNP